MKKGSDPESFPMTITSGSASVKLYLGANRGKPMFTLSYIDGSGRQRENFFNLAEAKREAKDRAQKLAAGDHAALQLTGVDRAAHVAAAEALKPSGVALDVAAREYAAARAILGEHSLVDAARHYLRTMVTLPSLKVGDAYAKYVAAKKSDGISELYAKDLNGTLGRFAKAFSCQLVEVTSDMIREYLTKLGVGKVTRNNHRRLIVGFFSHAKSQGWISKTESTAAEGIATAKVKHHAPAIYTPGEMREILDNADSELLPWIVLIAFCGVRREEVFRMNWSMVNFRAGYVDLPAHITKTGKRRKIDLQPAAKAFLAPYKDKTGTIFDIDPRRRIERLVALVNAKRATGSGATFKWRNNATRHSFGSYRLEVTRNAGAVALEMGNSAAIVMNHYQDVVTAKGAKAYWALRPRT